MRFLIDADLPRRTAGLLKTYGHEAVDVRDVGQGAVTQLRQWA
jgi:predicted nuclease of predicted toxin-antitoxin system